MKTAAGLAGPAAQMWSSMASTLKPVDSEDNEATRSRIQESVQAAFNAWNAMLSAAADPSAASAAAKGLGMLPDISLKLLETSVSGTLHFQKRWMERLKKLQDNAGNIDFEEMDREFLNRWTDVYKQEFQQFLNIPQIGLTRFYQEKMTRAVDKYNLFQSAMAEFMVLLTEPVEKSFRILQQQLTEQAKTGPLPEDHRVYYSQWIKILEGRYMTLFKSAEYTQAMGKTINAMNDFLSARKQVFEDMLQQFPVPTQKEMDELYREIYRLKKRLKRMEKQMNGA